MNKITKSTYYCSKCKSNHKFDSSIGRQHNLKNSPYYVPSVLKGMKPNECVMVKRHENNTVNEYILWFDEQGEVHRRFYREHPISAPKESEILKQPEKGDRKTMVKEFPENIKKSFAAMAKNQNRELSFMLDYERPETQPQRTATLQGGEESTVGNIDFELFGHSHPGDEVPSASTGDLYNMRLLYPDFIMSGDTGKVFFYNIENKDKFVEWKKNRTELIRLGKLSNAFPIDSSEINYLLSLPEYKDKPQAKKVTHENYYKTKVGQQMFFDITGVKIYTKVPKIIEIRDDPTLEKQMPSISRHQLKKFQNIK